MKTLERYVFGSFLSSFTLAFLVLTFVMTIGLMVQIVGLILDGIPASVVGEFALVSFPETLQWTMPLALLVSSVLVFSRMSADSEISAMRACGIHLIRVMKWPIVFAIVCTLLGIVVNNEIVPRGHEIRRSLKSRVSVGNGLEVLEPGKVIDDFPKAKIYFSSKEGNWIHGLIVMDYSLPGVDRMITASKALVSSEGRDIALDLYNMTVDPVDAEHRTMARANRFRYLVKDALSSSNYRKGKKDYRFLELLKQLDNLKKMYTRLAESGEDALKRQPRLVTDISEYKVELCKRLVFAIASLCFVLVGIPLGIKAQRKESTIGMALSLAIGLGYYMLVMLALGAEKVVAIHPELIIWLPVLACAIIAARLIPKHL